MLGVASLDRPSPGGASEEPQAASQAVLPQGQEKTEGVIHKTFSFRGKGQSVGSPPGSLLMVRCDLFDICYKQLEGEVRAWKDFCPARSFLLKETCACCFLTGRRRQRQSRAPVTLGWQFRSRSPEGSIFSPHHHVKQVHVSLLVLVILISSPVNRYDTTAVG